MANITIQNLEVESAALNQVSTGEIEKVVGGCSGRSLKQGMGRNFVQPQQLPDIQFQLGLIFTCRLTDVVVMG
jgi:hypothetical protein